MVMEMEEQCPACGEERTFWRVASTSLHLGEKTKWGCAADDCDRQFVRIDSTVNTAA